MIQRDDGNLVPIIELRPREREEAELLRSRDELAQDMRTLHGRIAYISKHMTKSIQDEAVGILRGQNGIDSV